MFEKAYWPDLIGSREDTEHHLANPKATPIVYIFWSLILVVTFNVQQGPERNRKYFRGVEAIDCSMS